MTHLIFISAEVRVFIAIVMSYLITQVVESTHYIDFQSFHIYIYIYTYTYTVYIYVVCVYVCEVHENAQGGQKRTSAPRMLALQAVVNCFTTGCWELNSRLFKEQHSLLTAEPSCSWITCWVWSIAVLFTPCSTCLGHCLKCICWVNSAHKGLEMLTVSLPTISYQLIQTSVGFIFLLAPTNSRITW